MVELPPVAEASVPRHGVVGHVALVDLVRVRVGVRVRVRVRVRCCIG